MSVVYPAADDVVNQCLVGDGKLGASATMFQPPKKSKPETQSRTCVKYGCKYLFPKVKNASNCH